MEQVLLSRDDLCIRWGLNKQTIINYESEGIITRVKNIPTPRYNLNEIMKVEGTELNPLSPLERKRLEKEKEEIKEELEKVKKELNLFKSKFEQIILILN